VTRLPATERRRTGSPIDPAALDLPPTFSIEVPLAPPAEVAASG